MLLSLLGAVVPGFAQSWTGNLGALGPTGLALANVSGNTILYVAEYEGGKIVAYNLTTGATTPTVINVPAGTFQNPNGIVVDPSSGDLFVTDRGLHKVVRITNTGTVQWSYGSLGNAAGQFNGPIGITRDSTGALYVTEHDGVRVQKFTVGPAGLVPVITGWPKTTAVAYAVVVDSSNNVYIGDRSGTVQKFSSAGTAITAGNISVGARFATGLFMTPADTLFVSQTLGASDNMVQRFASGSTTSNLQFGANGTGNGEFNTGFGVVVNGTKAYVADYENDRVQIFDLAITAAPVVNSSLTAQNATVGTPFSYQITATNSPFAFAAAGLPAGLSVNANTGLISGTPSAAGSASVTLTASNSIGTSANATLPITVTGGGGGDTTAPVVSAFSGTATGTTATFTLNFSESVRNLATTQFTATGSAGLTGATVTSVTPNGATLATNYTVTVSYAGTAGSITLALNSSSTAIQDASGNAFGGAGGPNTSAVATLTGGGSDTTAPRIDSFDLNAASATSGTWRVTFNENVTGVNAADFVVIGGGGATVTPGSIAVTAVDARTYDVTFGYSATTTGYLQGAILTTGTGITDTAGNAFVGEGFAASDVQGTGVSFDYPTLTTLTAGTVGASSVNLTATFSEAVTGVGASDFIVRPAGASVTGVSGSGTTYTVTVGFTTPGIYTVTAIGGATSAIRDTDTYYFRGGAASNSVNFTAGGGGGSAPVISSPATASGTVGVAFSYNIAASGSPTSYAATGLPAGLSVNTATGAITGTPTAAGTSNATISATNANGTGSATVSITIAAGATAPVISSAPTATGTVGTAFTYNITASGSPTSYAATGLPSGLQVNTTTGAITGTPTSAGTTTVTISATNAGGTGTATLTITVGAAGSAPVVSSPATASGTVGVAFSYNITASGSPTSYAATGLPSGLQVNATTGAITGTPTVAGTTSATVSATNANGTGSRVVAITIAAAPVAPVISSPATASGTVGVAFSYNIAASGSPTSYAAMGLPSGLQVNATTGAITGTPTAAGTTNATVSATNAAGTGSRAVTITITTAPAPTVSSATRSGQVGVGFSYSIVATGSPTSYAISSGSLPGGLTLNATTGVISGAPTASGNFSVGISATNAAGTGTGTLSLTIAPASTGGGGGPIIVIPQKQNQTISFAAPVSSVFVNVPVKLGATTSSNLPITYSVVSGNASISGDTLTVKGAGSIVVRAAQAGDSTYNPASVDATIDARRQAQSITFASLGNVTSSTTSVSLSASASSGLPVTLAVVSGPASLSGNTLSLTGQGTVMIRATQAGNETYDPAAEVIRSFSVSPGGTQVFFGTMGSDAFAASVARDNSKGTLVMRLGATGEGVVLKFNINADGTFAATTTTLGGASNEVSSDTAPRAAAARQLSFSGRVSNGLMTGSIAELDKSFSALAQPNAGSTNGYTGMYTAASPGSAGGYTYVIVGPNGQAYALAVTSAGAYSGTGTVSSSGAIDIALSSDTSLAANLNADGSLNGTVTAAGVSRTLLGLSEGTARTDRLLNLSSRLRVTSGDDSRAVFAGFVISGTTEKKVLIRAVGPGLSGFGITDGLSAPRLRIYDSAGAVLADNSGWNNNTDVSAVGDQVGAFKLAASSRDAAVVATLKPGAYSAQVSSTSGNGIALIELYDAATGELLSSQQLINISTRAYVDTGDGALIAGFVVTGNAPKRVLIRGIGPGLTAFGVPGAVADPTLKIYAAGSSTILAQNDNWETAQPVGTQIAATATEISAASNATGAFPLNAGSKDAAVIITLTPGNYSAVVAGAGNGTGAGMVEVYQLPE